MNSRALFRLNAKTPPTIPQPRQAAVSRSRGGWNQDKVLPPPPPLKLWSLAYFLASRCSTACPPPSRGKKEKRNCLWGSSTSCHQGELFETASLRNSPDNTPNMSTFCWSLVVFFFLFLGFSCWSGKQECFRRRAWLWKRRGYWRFLTGGSRTRPATGAEKFFFRNLVAWFSYLSQYIFTYLLLKWIPLQLIKKTESCK